MTKILRLIFPFRLYLRALLLLTAGVAACLFSSCFTGVEGTKKITLSREDKKAIVPTPEDQFFSSIEGKPLSEWVAGRTFMAADNKTALIFDQEGLSPDPDEMGLAGHLLVFSNIQSRLNADGSSNAVIVFTDGTTKYFYNTGKPISSAPEMVRSDQIPMLIDLSMVEQAATLLAGKTLWIKSPLWYDDSGARIPGRKYVPVTVTKVSPGSLVFPLKITFTDENGDKASAFINFGNGGSESRSFGSIFSLSDIRKKYPSISPDIWDKISAGKVDIGMTKEECRLSLGNPSEVSSGHDYSQTLDLWHYPDGKVLYFEDGHLTRFGH